MANEALEFTLTDADRRAYLKAVGGQNPAAQLQFTPGRRRLWLDAAGLWERRAGMVQHVPWARLMPPQQVGPMTLIGITDESGRPLPAGLSFGIPATADAAARQAFLAGLAAGPHGHAPGAGPGIDRWLDGDLGLSDYVEFNRAFRRGEVGRAQLRKAVLSVSAVGLLLGVLLATWLPGLLADGLGLPMWAGLVLSLLLGVAVLLSLLVVLPSLMVPRGVRQQAERGLLRTGRVRWGFGPSGVLEQAAGGSVLVEWPTIRRIERGEGVASVFFDTTAALIIPVRDADAAAFVDELTQRWTALRGPEGGAGVTRS